MADISNSIMIVAVMALGTAFLRFLPFIIFKDETPKYLQYLGDVLPQAIIAMLVVYCFKDVSFTSYPHGLPALIAGAAAALTQWRSRNSVLSILAGTALYMVLVQNVFV